MIYSESTCFFTHIDVLCLFLSLSVLLEVYHFYWFFGAPTFCFIDILCCFPVFSFIDFCSIFSISFVYLLWVYFVLLFLKFLGIETNIIDLRSCLVPEVSIWCYKLLTTPLNCLKYFDRLYFNFHSVLYIFKFSFETTSFINCYLDMLLKFSSVQRFSYCLSVTDFILLHCDQREYYV